MKKTLALLIMSSLTGFAALLAPQPTRSADDKSKYLDRIENSGVVLKEILDVPDDIPQSLLDKAECVIIYPSVLKAAFGIGASYGRGVMTCRGGEDFTGPWGSPSMMALEGGSIGFQIGAQATDFVLLVMNDRGASSILSSKVKLGADASAAAGPKGRDAEADTDVTMRAEVLSYSRARGLFAGISLEGSTVRPDNDGNEVVYGARVAARDVVLKGTVTAPKEANLMISLLNKRSPHNVSDRK
jgi:lipid-binding SYLF domain-containing protein